MFVPLLLLSMCVPACDRVLPAAAALLGYLIQGLGSLRHDIPACCDVGELVLSSWWMIANGGETEGIAPPPRAQLKLGASVTITSVICCIFYVRGVWSRRWRMEIEEGTDDSKILPWIAYLPYLRTR